jgi:hypothetical protein
MAEYTKNYKFKCPEATDYVNVEELNENFNSIDQGIRTVEEKEEQLKLLLDEKAGKEAATGFKDGLMSTSDKIKLDGVADRANNYVHPVSHPASIITGLPTSLPANGGNADTIGNVGINNLVRRYELNSIDISKTTIDTGSYITTVSNNSSAPNTSFWHIIHTGYGSDGYAAQVGLPFYGSADIYVRSANGTTWGAWRKISIGYGTTVPTSLSEGEVFLVYE